jgi:hypothetical protein
LLRRQSTAERLDAAERDVDLLGWLWFFNFVGLIVVGLRAFGVL